MNFDDEKRKYSIKLKNIAAEFVARGVAPYLAMELAAIEIQNKSGPRHER